MAEKQLIVNNIAESKKLSAVNQILTRVNGPKSLKAIVHQALNGSNPLKSHVLQSLMGI